MAVSIQRILFLAALSGALVASPRGAADEGGPSARHWAFRAPVRPPLPAVDDESWVRNPIDRFVLARLEKEGLKPSPESDRVTLLRRLSLDLVGLPPAVEDVDAFLADQAPGAWERQVERLLRSPHYGERQARLWLDAARYADSDGYEKDKPREVWFWRDWVIDAFNRDLPWDRFIIEQIAGDLLPNPRQDEIVATGFLRNSMINEEGGIDPEQFRMEAMFDRMDAIGKSMLGLTIQCAQCHDHKYDPLTQEEYYRLFAFINNCHEGNIAVYTDPENAARRDIEREIASIEEGLKRSTPDWREREAAWEDAVRYDAAEWIVVRPEVDEISTGGQKYLPMGDGSFLAQGYAPTKHTVKLTARVDRSPITAVRLELLTDPNLPRGGPGRSIFGTAALTEIEVYAAPASAPGEEKKLEIAKATADVAPAERGLPSIYDDKSDRRRVTGPVAYAIDRKDETAWGTDIDPGRRNRPRKAVFTLAEPVSHEGGTLLTFRLVQNHGGWNSDDNQNHNLGRFRLSITATPGATADPLPPEVRQAIRILPAARSAKQTALVFSAFRSSIPEWKEANDRIDTLWASYPEGTTQLVLLERDSLRTTHILHRGSFLEPEREVEPGVPAFLHSFPEGAPRNRLGFAQWLVDRRSPTTARAVINRTWQSYWGTGIVATSEDLGKQADPPSHPELLDWLAVELMDGGWSLKSIHRLIVTSATYRQSSPVSPELLALDPANRLFARGPRMRVDAEIVRDIALAASGLLDPRIGGPSVHPPIPEFMLSPPVSYGPKSWPVDEGADRYRRALYTFRFRSIPYPSLQTFDAPNGDFACVRRARSNTPLQALMTLNEPVFVECARALAERALEHEEPSDRRRLTWAFRRCLAREPEGRELDELERLLERQRARYAAGEANPEPLASLRRGESEDTDSTASTEIAAWTVVARVLLNLDETITKE